MKATAQVGDTSMIESVLFEQAGLGTCEGGLAFSKAIGFNIAFGGPPRAFYFL